MKDRKIVIVAHKFLTQPDDDLVVFLNGKKYEHVLHIKHSFADAADRCSQFSWYKNGELFQEYRTRNFNGHGELFIYLKELYFTVKWLRKTGVVFDTYIGMDGLCVLFGMLSRFANRAKKVIYWAIDFVPEKRFNGRLKNKIYRAVNIFGCKHADEMWDLGVRMTEAREKFWGIKKTDYKLHKVVPYGVWTKRIKKYSYNECDKNVAVFMGHLLEKQGAQLIIAIMPEIIKKIPDFKFKIIGTGAFKDALVKQTEQLNVSGACDFKGKINDIKELENEVAKACVAVAPYIKNLDTWTYYADPGKVKTYLACGVPLLLTDLPWNAREIEGAECGAIITEDKDEILEKLLKLMQAPNNDECRRRAIEYSKNFDYERIFDSINI